MLLLVEISAYQQHTDSSWRQVVLDFCTNTLQLVSWHRDQVAKIELIAQLALEIQVVRLFFISFPSLRTNDLIEIDCVAFPKAGLQHRRQNS